MVKEALTLDKKTRKDRLYLIAWVWARMKYIPNEKGFYEYLIKIYKFLVNNPDPDTIVRKKEKMAEKSIVFRESFESTESLRRKLIGGEQSLF